MIEQNKNTKKEDLFFLKEYTSQGVNFWSTLLSPKKK